MTQKRALIGHTGFIGSNFLRWSSFDALAHSPTVHELRGRSFDEVYCCGAPGVKWLANKNPETDWRSLSSLMEVLGTIEARRFLLISTVDVYPTPEVVDESVEPDENAAAPYGKHRRRLETFVMERFSNATIVRLPALFGPGLKKNVVYDLLNENALHLLQPASVFQFYDLDKLWSDLQRIQSNNVSVVNLATEPVSVAEVALHGFGRTLPEAPQLPVARYDFRTRHASLWGRRDGYAYGRDEILQALAQFVRRSTERKTA